MRRAGYVPRGAQLFLSQSPASMVTARLDWQHQIGTHYRPGDDASEGQVWRAIRDDPVVRVTAVKLCCRYPRDPVVRQSLLALSPVLVWPHPSSLSIITPDQYAGLQRTCVRSPGRFMCFPSLQPLGDGGRGDSLCLAANRTPWR